MHSNLERRFIRLEVNRSGYQMALESFRVRYHLLFAALADQLGVTPKKLAKRVGFDPVPEGGNKIMRGEAEASTEDCLKLMAVYLEEQP